MIDAFKSIRENPTSFSRELLTNGLISGVLGAGIGVILAFVVNSTLFQIVINNFFAWYFGILFILIALLLHWRLMVQSDHEITQQRRTYAKYCANILLIAGLICPIMHSTIFKILPKILRVPVFSTLGIALAFSLAFTCVDLINFIFSFLRSSIARPVIDTLAQVQTLLAASMLLGGIFGLMFGILDYSSRTKGQIRRGLVAEQHSCLPIGIILGGLVGLLNELLRQHDVQQFRAVKADFDDEI